MVFGFIADQHVEFILTGYSLVVEALDTSIGNGHTGVPITVKARHSMAR